MVQLSRLLGHHSPAFTLTVYAHLIDGNVGEALDLGPSPLLPVGGDRDLTGAKTANGGSKQRARLAG